MRRAGLIWRKRRSQGRNTPCTRGRRRKVTRLLKKHPPRLQTCHVWYGSHLFSQHNSLNTWVRDIGRSGCSWNRKRGVERGDGEWREVGGGGFSVFPACAIALAQWFIKKKKKRENKPGTDGTYIKIYWPVTRRLSCFGSYLLVMYDKAHTEELHWNNVSKRIC